MTSIDHGRFLPGVVLERRNRIVGLLGAGSTGELDFPDPPRPGAR